MSDGELDYSRHCFDDEEYDFGDDRRPGQKMTSAVLLVPPSEKLKFRLNCSNSHRVVLKILPEIMEKAKTDSKATEDLRCICDMFLPTRSSYEEFSTLDSELEDRIACYNRLTALCIEKNWSSLLDRVPTIVQEEPGNFENITRYIAEKGLGKMEDVLFRKVSAQHAVSKRYEILKSIMECFRSTSMSSGEHDKLIAWQRKSLTKLLPRDSRYNHDQGSKYGISLAAIAKDCPFEVSETLMQDKCLYTKGDSPLGHFIFAFHRENNRLDCADQRRYLQLGLDKFWHTLGDSKFRAQPNAKLQDCTRFSKLQRLLDLTNQYSTVSLQQAVMTLQDMLPSVQEHKTVSRNEFKDKWLPMAAQYAMVSFHAYKISSMNLLLLSWQL